MTVARSIVKHGDWVHIKCAPGHFQTYGVNQSLCHDGEFQSSLHDVACYGTCRSINEISVSGTSLFFVP